MCVCVCVPTAYKSTGGSGNNGFGADGSSSFGTSFGADSSSNGFSGGGSRFSGGGDGGGGFGGGGGEESVTLQVPSDRVRMIIGKSSTVFQY